MASVQSMAAEQVAFNARHTIAEDEQAAAEPAESGSSHGGHRHVQHRGMLRHSTSWAAICDFMQASQVPVADCSVDVSSTEESIAEQVKVVCQAVIPQWRQVSSDTMHVSRISGGITNILLCVAISNSSSNSSSKPEEVERNAADETHSKVSNSTEQSVVPTKVAQSRVVPSEAVPSKVAVRVFGPYTEVVINRKRELQATKSLSDAGFGAHLIGGFKNGVIQSFISARTLDSADVADPAISRRIACLIRRFHAVEVPGEKQPQLWPTVSKYIELARQLSFSEPSKQKQFERISLEQVEAEVDQLRKLAEQLNAPVVFGHNDLLPGNFMLDESRDELHIIDFEYGNYTYRGYDFGNHFNEFGGLECDYSRYPSKEFQFEFFRHYLQPDRPHEVSVEELEQVYREAEVFSLASHLLWAVWSLLQANYSSIDFDYLDYYHKRMNEYRRRKPEVLQLSGMP